MASEHTIFEWDPVKAEANLTKHGVSFEIAAKAMKSDGQPLQWEGDRGYDERRFVTVADWSGRLLTAVWTRRGDATRLISARRANRKEQSDYERANLP